jgi:protocatechuate 3,4-dioxygenase beta subunit
VTVSADVGEQTTLDAIRRMEACPDARLRSLMAGVIRHLHDFAREYRVSEGEWRAAIEFLTRTGQTCSGVRQEFILLSDVLGVSMVVDAINHTAEGAVTESTVFGPFYSGEQPELEAGASILRRDEPGEMLTLEGMISSENGFPLAGAKVEVWQTAANGMYDAQDINQPAGHMRGTFRADATGCYHFRTVTPVGYSIPDDGPVGQLLRTLGRHPFRPAHIHFMISAANHRRLVTHLFIAGDRYLESDAVFGVKPSLVVTPMGAGNDRHVWHDFVLAAAAA